MPDVASLADLVASTRPDPGKGRWTDLTTDLQEMVALPSLLRKNRAQFGSGSSIKTNVMKSLTGNARHTSLYAQDTVNVDDVLTSADVPWRHSTTAFAIDEREIAMNNDPEEVVNLLKVRRADAMIDKAKLIEEAFWNKPASSSDVTTPWGIFMPLVYNATVGFNGGNPSGFSDYAGIDRDSVARWKNFAGQYTNITKADLINKMRQAIRKTRFIPPVNIPQYGSAFNFGIYVNYTVLSGIEDLAEQQNDRLGNDVASKDGMALFHRIPLMYVPQLDGNDVNTDPVIGINWSVFKIAFLKGYFMKESKPIMASNQHNVVQVHVDTSWNTLCRDPRKCFLLAKS